MIKFDKYQATARLAAAIPSLGLRRLLLVSLAANLLVLGFVAGDLLADVFDKRPHNIEMSLGPIARALDESDRKAILNDLRNKPAMADFHHGVADIDSAGLARALRAEPFDAAAFRAAMAAQAAKVSDAQTALQDSLISHLVSMPFNERKELADRLMGNY